MIRRKFLHDLLLGSLVSAGLPTLGLASTSRGSSGAIVAATWRGPRATDQYVAGVLKANWETRSLSIGYAVSLPSRAHGLVAEHGGQLLICAARPGSWLMRCDDQGKILQLVSMGQEGSSRLSGHAVISPDGELIYTTEMDYYAGQGKIGVRDRRTLKKLAEWHTHGIDPHQLLLDHEGHLMVANGGVPRDLNDKKLDRHNMNSSLVRLNKNNGQLMGQWRMNDSFLSLRHMAWSDPASPRGLLGIAMQAEHPNVDSRKAAPVLAVFDGAELSIPTKMSDGVGYAGDIASAHGGGFALSSNQANLTTLWHPGIPKTLQPIVKIQQAYATASWPGPDNRGGVLVATAPGLVRWHPTAEPLLLPWPEPMALDNHWITVAE